MSGISRRYVAGAATLVVLAAMGCERTPTGAVHQPAVDGAPVSGSIATPQARPPTTPNPAAPTGWGPTVAEWRAARRAVSKLPDAELAGQVIVADYPGTAAPVGLVKRYHLAGVIVLGDNIASTVGIESANRALQASVHRGWPLVISTDQEGGIVQRVGEPLTQFPTFMSYGAADDPALTERAAQASGEELRGAGFTMVFAPDADVTIGPADPTIGSRSAGGDPAAVSAQVLAADEGYQRSGIVSVIKHFPGHGSVTTDSHQALPVQGKSLKELAASDFVPFAAAVKAGTNAVMVGHIAVTAVDPGVPADLSAKDVALLTSRLGFQGMITTDALDMGAISNTTSSSNAAVDSLRAGVDMILMPADLGAAYDGILDALRNGTLSRTRVETAAAKIVALMMHERDQSPALPASVGTHDALSEQVSAQALTLVSGACHGPYVGSTVTPLGDSTSVGAFDRAARAAGLRIGAGGTTVALLAYRYGPASADVVVSLDTPYVLASSRASVAKLALFGSNTEAMSALVAVLTGKDTAHGRLPVSVQGLDQQRRC